ncbi:hypothetical protein OQA88_4332 [Cercophora sp. LCS_1]
MSESDCKYCNTLLEAVAHFKSCDIRKKGDQSYCEWTCELGNREEIFDQGSCTTHQSFLEACLGGWARRKSFDLDLKCGSEIGLVVKYLSATDGLTWYTWPAELLIVEETSCPPTSSWNARTLQHDSVDFGLINQWWTDCKRNHGSECGAVPLASTNPPFISWLVDTQRMCVVEAPEGASYCALSYVWGRRSFLKSHTGNISALQEEGALADPNNELPATIRDAIEFVRGIGGQYLWVDALCIVQDDPTSMMHHLRDMASIFERAALTIVAATGRDACAGLAGFSRARVAPPTMKLTDKLWLKRRSNNRLDGAPWSGRAWTLQEQIFSSRMVIFFDDSVRWTCRRGGYEEDVREPIGRPCQPKRANNVVNIQLETLSTIPDMTYLGKLISLYSSRRMTLDEDALPGIMSTLGAMRPAFPRGFLCGLPASFLDQALLWRAGEITPSSKRGLRRRVPSVETAVCPPSWTWAGWQGYLDNYMAWATRPFLKNEIPGYVPITHSWQFRVIPCLEWGIKVALDDVPTPIPFQNETYEWKRLYMGKKNNLPDGWLYEPESPEDIQKYKDEYTYHDEGDGKEIHRYDDPDNPISRKSLFDNAPFYYRHVSCPDFRFWHPIPLGSDLRCEDATALESWGGRYLCAQTQRVRFRAVKPRDDRSFKRAASFRGPDSHILPMFSIKVLVNTMLLDEVGNEIGELSPNTKEDLEGIWNSGQDGVSCELVAVSKGFDFVQPQLPEHEIWTFYNVLWVEWCDGVAYRKGVGRVKRRAWEEARKENVDLVLG